MYVIYQKIKVYPTKEQAIAELYSRGAIVQGHSDFIGDNVYEGHTISSEYKLEKEK